MTEVAGKSPPGSWYLRLAVGVLVVAAGLRFYDLGGPSLWFDEIVYALNSRGTLGDVLANTQHNNSSPIGLPLVLHGLDLTTGLAEVWARLPSAMFGVASVGLMLLLPRVGVARSTALGAACLIALGQMQVYYAQEVREYALSILVSAWILLTALHAARTGLWKPLALAGAAAPWLAYGPCFAYLAVIGWLGFYKLLRRFPVNWLGLGLLSLAFFVSAAAAYALVARHQLGLGQQWYLAEHYLSASGMNPLVWVAANTGGILLASLPGLLGVVAGGVIVLGWIVVRLPKPSRLLDEPVLTLAAVLAVGMCLAGVIGLYPFGSPRHSVFLGPFLALAVATATQQLIAAAPASRKGLYTSGMTGVFLASGILALIGFTPGADVHPAIAKVASIRVYGEYQDSRALIDFARTQSDKPLYAVVGAVPAAQYYGSDLEITQGALKFSGNPEQQAADIARHVTPAGLVVLAANMQDGELDAISAELSRRGYAYETPFTATRVSALVVRPLT